MIKTPFTTSTPIKPNASTQPQTNSDGDQEPVQLQKPEPKSSMVRLGESIHQPCLNGDWMRYFNTPSIDIKPPLFDFYSHENGAHDDQKNTSLSEFNNLAKLLTSNRSFRRNSDIEQHQDDYDESLQMVVKNLSNPISVSSGSEEAVVQSDEDEYDAIQNEKKNTTFNADESPDSKLTFDRTFSTAESTLSDRQSVDMPNGTVCFKRKYQPTLLDETQANEINATHQISKVYESRIEKILRIMNTSNTEFAQHRIQLTHSNVISKHSTNTHNYSFYALLFMIASNLTGLTLSLTFQVLLFLKLNSDRFLNHSWRHWQHATVLQRDNNIVTLILMLPLILVVLVAYVSIWLTYNVNRLLLTSVPDRLADWINFNIHIVQ